MINISLNPLPDTTKLLLLKPWNKTASADHRLMRRPLQQSRREITPKKTSKKDSGQRKWEARSTTFLSKTSRKSWTLNLPQIWRKSWIKLPRIPKNGSQPSGTFTNHLKKIWRKNTRKYRKKSSRRNRPEKSARNENLRLSSGWANSE